MLKLTNILTFQTLCHIVTVADYNINNKQLYHIESKTEISVVNALNATVYSHFLR